MLMGELDVSFKISPVFYVTMAFCDMLRSFRQNLELDVSVKINTGIQIMMVCCYSLLSLMLLY